MPVSAECIDALRDRPGVVGLDVEEHATRLGVGLADVVASVEHHVETVEVEHVVAGFAGSPVDLRGERLDVPVAQAFGVGAREQNAADAGSGHGSSCCRSLLSSAIEALATSPPRYRLPAAAKLIAAQVCSDTKIAVVPGSSARKMCSSSPG